MDHAICTAAAAPVRKEPNHRAEMVNQLLFGETMHLLEEKDEWFKIRSTYDDYEGWLTCHLIKEISSDVASAETNFLATEIVNQVFFYNSIIYVPMGAALTGFNEKTKSLWNENFKYSGSFRNVKLSFDSSFLLKTALHWLNAPYLWGGKTFMGTDCSGFVQTVYKILGLPLKRDAYQQAKQGTAIENLAEAKEGDLTFFHNESGKIIHVGIVLNDNRIIHASGKVRIDRIDEEGIINMESGKRTHFLSSVRRMF